MTEIKYSKNKLRATIRQANNLNPQNISNLREIYIRYANMRNIPNLSNCSKLKRVILYCCNAYNKQFDIHFPDKLDYLDIFNNDYIFNITIHTKSINKLRMGFCKQDFPLSLFNVKIRILDLCFVYCKNINFTIKNLIEVNIKFGHKFHDLLNNNKQIKFLKLDSVDIEEPINMPNLRRLYLTYSELKISDGIIVNAPKLEYLEIYKYGKLKRENLLIPDSCKIEFV